jgi:16S rRNA (guanine527-N7)-methyltransferase
MDTPRHLTRLAQFSQDLLGLALTDAQLLAFEQYAALLVEWNAKVNLTAITDYPAVEVKHFLDSLSVIKAISLTPGLRVIDVGTGAGFPGLPLKIIQPALKMVLMEATGKKATFLGQAAATVGVPDTQVVNLRAEEAGQLPAHREQYDVVVARAVARMPALMEYLLPLCKVGGRCVAMKGDTATDELTDAERALKVLGGRHERTIKVELPEMAEPHYLVVIEKVSATPASFPRKPGTPTKKPI